MNNTLNIRGQCFDGRHPVGRKVVLSIDAVRARLLEDGQQEQVWPVSQLRASPRVANAPRFIQLPDGSQFHCSDQQALDRLPQAERLEGSVAWLERHVAVAVAGIAIVIALVAAAHQFGLPRLAKVVAKDVPMATEQALGDEVIQWMDENWLFSATELDSSTRSEIQKGFSELSSGMMLGPYLRLEFRSAPPLGPNAFALPGGLIIMTDQMVYVAKDTNEILAVLAHEIGHVRNRHIMRHLIQDSATALLVASVTGDAASLSLAVVGLPTLVAQASYSRDFEREADEFAFDLLREHGISPSSFADIMGRLDDGKGSALPPFLSSHPLTEERIMRARDASMDPDEPES